MQGKHNAVRWKGVVSCKASTMLFIWEFEGLLRAVLCIFEGLSVICASRPRSLPLLLFSPGPQLPKSLNLHNH